MSKTRDDLIKDKLNKARNKLEAVDVLLESQPWEAAASQLYYSCFSPGTGTFLSFRY